MDVKKAKDFWDNAWQIGPASSGSYPFNLTKKDGRVLDVGCGDFSAMCKSISDPDASVVGIDLSKHPLLGIRKAKVGRPHIEAVQGSGTMLPFKDNSFDLCVSSASSGLAGEYILDLLKEMRRVGSKIKISLDHIEYQSSDRNNKDFVEMPYGRGILKTNRRVGNITINAFDAKSAEILIRDAGFKPVKIAELNPYGMEIDQLKQQGFGFSGDAHERAIVYVHAKRI